MTCCCTETPICQSLGRTPEPSSSVGIEAAAEHRLAEVSVAQLTAEIAAGWAAIVGVGIEQIAVGHVVAVGIGPWPGDRGRRAQHRAAGDARGGVGQRVGVVIRRRFEILADVHLHRRLPVAEQVVGCAAARRDVVVALDAILRRKCESGGQKPHRSDLLIGEIAPGVVVANGALQRQPASSSIVPARTALPTGCAAPCRTA